jgi:hypothetical protein
MNCLSGELISEFKLTTDSVEEDGPSIFKSIKLNLKKSEELNGEDPSNEIALRFYHNNTHELKMRKELSKNQFARQKQFNEEYQKDRLVSIYRALILVDTKAEYSKHLNSLINNLKDRLQIERTLAKKGRFDVTDLLVTENLLIEMEKEKSHTNSVISIHMGSIKDQIKHGLSLENLRTKTQLISILELEKLMKNVVPRRILSKLEFERSKFEYEISNEENNSMLDYTELEFEKKTKTQTQEDEYKIGVKVSFNIPFGVTKFKTNEKLLDRMKAEAEHRSGEIELRSESKIIRSELQENINSYWASIKSKHLIKIKKYFKIHSKTKSSSPLKGLKLKQMIIEHEIKKIILKEKIYLGYLEFIHMGGVPISEVEKTITFKL